MKKVKIMLLAICVVAVTGGLVAFKTLTPRNFCTTDATQTEIGGFYTCKDAQGQFLICDDLIEIVTSETETNNEVNGNVFCVTDPTTTIEGGIETLTCLGDPCVEKEYQTDLE